MRNPIIASSPFLALLLAMTDFDATAKQDAVTAMTALTHLRKHVADSRAK